MSSSGRLWGCGTGAAGVRDELARPGGGLAGIGDGRSEIGYRKSGLTPPNTRSPIPHPRSEEEDHLLVEPLPDSVEHRVAEGVVAAADAGADFHPSDELVSRNPQRLRKV